jgi:hypothetical protein
LAGVAETVAALAPDMPTARAMKLAKNRPTSSVAVLRTARMSVNPFGSRNVRIDYCCEACLLPPRLAAESEALSGVTVRKTDITVESATYVTEAKILCNCAKFRNLSIQKCHFVQEAPAQIGHTMLHKGLSDRSVYAIVLGLQI